MPTKEQMGDAMQSVKNVLEEKLPGTYFCLTAVTVEDKSNTVNFISTLTHESTISVLEGQVAYMKENPEQSEKIFLK